MDLGCQALTVCEETQVARLCKEPLGCQTGNEVKIPKTKIKQTTKLCRPKYKAQLRRAGWILGLASRSRGEAGRRASWRKRKRPGPVSLVVLRPCWGTQQAQFNKKRPNKSDRILPGASGGQSTLSASCPSTQCLLSSWALCDPGVEVSPQKTFVPARIHQPAAGGGHTAHSTGLTHSSGHWPLGQHATCSSRLGIGTRVLWPQETA